MKFKPYRAILIIIFLIFIAGNVLSQTAIKEDDLKAAFIYNFTKFVQWPDFDSIETFHITVLGNSGIIDPLKKLEGTKQVNKKNIIVSFITDISEIDKTQILFISEPETQEIDSITKRLENRNVLMVSDTKGMASKGTAINFVLIEGKLKFELNTSVCEEAELKVSSQLQKLAILVK